MQKTNKAIAKRFKKTGAGKLLYRKHGYRHLLRKKSVKQKRRARDPHEVSKGRAADLKRGMPFG